jgi:DNA-directed RNA polymerase specialized sigma24 family protein
MMAHTDGSLVHAVLAGDGDAFAVLVRRHQASMFRFAVRMCGDRDDADDVVQAAFVRAYRNLAQCRELDRFAAWLRQIVMNECRTLLATRSRRSRWFVADEAVLAATPAPVESVEARGLPPETPGGPELRGDGRADGRGGLGAQDAGEAGL